MKQVDVIVIGAGAAGLMCAAQASARGRRTLVLDHANKVGKKILMSGGGRCNFTNYYVEPSHYLSNNEHFCISALKRYTQYDFIALVEQYNLEYHEKSQGQLFCDHKAQDILTILLNECDKNGVDIITKCTINTVNRVSGASRFSLSTSHGDYQCESLVIATGGLSIPTMGATGFGYQVAKQFSLEVTPTQAGLVPFMFQGKALELSNALAGVSTRAKLSLSHTNNTTTMAFTDQLLFTHRGISGPAPLQLSNYWQLGQPLVIDFLPDISLDELYLSWQTSTEKRVVKNLLAEYIPKRVIEQLLPASSEDYALLQTPCHRLTQEQLAQLKRYFKHWQVTPSNTEGYRTAEVTLGGVNTDELSSKTFESKKVPGLFFIGEVVDVTGWLGGYNFQWAWASGFCAAQYV